mmetsp:Transcript_20624/g.52346  ORF Transcript_20624/g.52346 Transcript_20624/m.52346 type:complete len:88 (+) Transcript_20624:1650-1913(+)
MLEPPGPSSNIGGVQAAGEGYHHSSIATLGIPAASEGGGNEVQHHMQHFAENWQQEMEGITEIIEGAMRAAGEEETIRRLFAWRGAV